MAGQIPSSHVPLVDDQGFPNTTWYQFFARTEASATSGNPSNTPGTIGQYWRGDLTWQTLNKAAVGLASADDTADEDKAVFSATVLATPRNIAMTGDVAWNVNFDGSANVTAAGTLATVNADVGTFGSASKLVSFTVNGKGLVTAAAEFSGSALTKTDDTNVTLTLGGTPATALLQAVSITVGWAGTLAVGRGGTGSGTAAGARVNLLPSFTGNGLKFLRVNAGETDAEWAVSPSYVPVVTGAEPPVLLSDGAGGLIFVPWSP